MNPHPFEVVPSHDELLPYADRGLDEIRFRRNGRMTVGLFMRREDHAMVVGISTPGASGTPFIFSVEREKANEVFEDTYPNAPSVGKAIMEDLLLVERPKIEDIAA
jgi:hypothetical protein